MQVRDRSADTLLSVCLDLGDGPDISPACLDSSVDVIFKRSLVGRSSRPSGKRVLPYGLVFECRSGHEGLLLQHSLRSIQGLCPPADIQDIKLIGWTLKTTGRLVAGRWWNTKELPRRLAQYEHHSDAPAEEAIFFQTRVWDPSLGSDPVDRQRVNGVRVQTIRTLKRTFGKRFVGGLVPSRYAIATYPDCITSWGSDNNQYTAQLRRCAIAVSTTGLFGSVPFKIPEYLAAARAIVTEPLRVILPRQLRAEGEILTFATASECVEQCDRLLAMPRLRNALRRNAAEYYVHNVRPDSLLRGRFRDLRAEGPPQISRG
ncbi:MAG: glycosyltransferase [Acidimicrobiales bacterium]